MLAIAAACSSGGGRGDACDEHGDCDRGLQCLAGACVPLCQRAPECGDGYACDLRGYCQLATGQQGDTCTAEAGCAPGLACEINGDAVDDNGQLLASCTMPNVGHPAGATCASDVECRDGTCALGHCVDLCATTRDCAAGLACMTIPRIDENDPVRDQFVGMFQGCLPVRGNLEFPVEVEAPTQRILLPVPSGATAVALTMAVDDTNQLVGARRVVAPDGTTLLATCDDASPQSCDPLDKLFSARIRHRPDFGQSVLQIPTEPSTLLEVGVYEITVSSMRPTDTNRVVTGSAVPRVTAVMKLDTNIVLDLHFHFLDLDDHVCASALGSAAFDAEVAKTNAGFQDDFVGELRTIFARGGVSIGALTYEDVANHPELDGLDLVDAPSLLSLGNHRSGIDVFFVRTLSPVGLQAFGPNPGPAGIAGTRQSGIVVGVDALCYRSWTEVARLAAHELARYMGLPHNVEIDGHDDHIDDNNAGVPSANLMFYSELGGTELSAGQAEILKRSPVLR